MRYHTRSPFRPRSPNLPNDVSVQRSNPTCSLSLTSVSVLGNVAPDSTSSSDAMAIDSLPAALVTMSPLAKIPFPKRPHSLLRSTTSSVLPVGYSRLSTSTAQESDETDSPQEFDPPRKRTRTSSLSTSTRTRPKRPTSTPGTVTFPSVDTVTPLLITPPAVSLSDITPPRYEESSHPNFPPSNPEPVGSSSQDLASISPDLPTPPSPSPSCVSSILSSPQRHLRRVAAGDMRTLLYLYRTLVYGLEVKYSDRHGKVKESQELSNVCDTSASCRVKAKSYFDLHDALLAQHLKMFLLASGADVHLLVVNIEDVAREQYQDIALEPSDNRMKMDVEDNSNMLSPQDNSFPHPHLHPTTIHSILSYQQLVASLIMRHRLPRLHRRNSSKLVKQRSKPSGLAECISLE